MPDLIETLRDEVVTLTMNRPERLNAISAEMVEALLEALPRLAADRAVRCIILAGAGRAFCAGGDMKAMAGRTERSFEDRVEGLRHIHRIPLLLANMQKVVVARVNGPAAGAGFSLALACDFRIASRSARFSPAFSGVGLSGDYGGSWTLSRLVGTARAKEIYLLNETVNSEVALADGLVTRLVDDEMLEQETESFARRIAEGATLAQGYMKRALLAAETEPFSAILDLEATYSARTGMSADHAEAIRAFAEKRRPSFRGS